MFNFLGVRHFDILQGQTVDCYLLAGIISLTQSEEMFSKVVPCNQTFSKPSYNGKFNFRFWNFDRFVDVCIDDRLPTISNELCFCKSKNQSEFWSALLEKAYLKYTRDYVIANKHGRYFNNVMYHFGARTTRAFSTNQLDSIKDSFKMLSCIFQGNTYMAALTNNEAKEKHGLIKMHAYSVIGFEIRSNKQLIRLYNPWGKEEWNGQFSDR